MNIDGFGGLGAARAMEELGYKPGDVIMIAIDDVQETLDRIKDGYLYGTMTQNFFRMGYEPVLWLQDFVKDGKKPSQVINDSGTMLVTTANINTFKQDMRDPSKW
jgi:ribose transport system substrate-binding protein